MTDIEKHFARCFGTASGGLVLEHLRRITIGRTLGPNATDNELRWLESQRSLVRSIEVLIQRGRGDKS
ncbi:MAG: hypothetical protein IKW57_04300 [Alphaproteobacteria bacterium]|nr:hypothetical protein [Alphaproteobacteria bacterium]